MAFVLIKASDVNTMKVQFLGHAHWEL